MSTDTRLKIEKVGKVWRAQYDSVTICSCHTKRATEQNAEYLMQHMQPETWRALVRQNEGPKSPSLAIRFGNRKTILAIDSFAAAQRAVNALRDRMELEGRGGASRFPRVRILDISTGATIGHISYNGRMWEGEPKSWTPTTREIHNA